MPLNIGEVNKLIVKRKTNISYSLKPLHEVISFEIFLHLNQATKELNEGEIIDAFLYYDNKRRLCATMETPLVTTSKIGYCKVVNVIPSLGCFVNIGIVKDILLSKDFLPQNIKSWPKTNEEIPCILKLKKDTIVAKLVSKEDITNKLLKLQIGDKVDATVAFFTSGGIILYTKDFDIIYVHKSLTRKFHHIGEIVNVTIVNINEQKEYNGSLIEQKEKMRLVDSELILKYLHDFGGVLKLGNASTPEQIAKVFPLSKGAFKRAVGALYKERLITISEDTIKLVKKD